MSVSDGLHEGVNWHRLHCDHERCPETFTVDERHGDLDRLRDIAGRAGWSWLPRESGPAPRGDDFCPRHAVAEFKPRAS